MKQVTTITVILCSLFIHSFGQTPNFRFKNYGEQAGLSQSVIHKILQDKRGYLWLATENGLNRFDGKKFKIYKKQEYPDGLPWSNVKDFVEDTIAGTLWIATTARGLCVFDYKKDLFRAISNGNFIDVNINFINMIGDQLWVSTKSGVSIINRGSESVIKNIHLKKDIKNVVPLNNQTVAAFSNDGYIYLINQLNLELVSEINPHISFKDRNNFAVWNVTEQTGIIWICTTTGLYKIEASPESFGRPLQKKIIRTPDSDLTNSDFHHVLTDKHANTWISTNGKGVLFKGPNDSTYHQFQKEIVNHHSISDDYVWQAYEDRTGNIWLATEKNLNRIVPRPMFIETIGQESDLRRNLLSRLFAIGTNNDKILILGRLDDVVIYNLQTRTPYTAINKTGSALGRNYIIYPWKKEQFLLGTKYGLKLLDIQGSVYSIRNLSEYRELETLANSRITSIAMIDSNNMLLGGIGGLGLLWWDIRNHQLISYSRSDNPNSLVNNNVNKIYRSRNGDFWIGTDAGLSKFNAATKSFENYFGKDKNNEAQYINDIAEFNGHLWLTFYQKGLAKWDFRTSVKVFDEAHGLNSNVIYNLRSDNKNIWLSSSKGLIAFDPEKEIFVNYTVEDGIQDNEFNRFCVFDTESFIYFGGISGLNIISKDRANLYRAAPPVTIGQISYLKGDHYETYQELYKGRARLRHFQNNITFEFASLDFSSNFRTNYAYMLAGYDENWIVHTGNQNSVTYTNINPGKYVFKVKPINSEYSGEIQACALPVYIVPAWYQTFLFRALVIVFIAGVLYYFVRLYYLARMRKQKMEYEKMIAVQEERARISSEIHDDIGAGLSGVRLLAEMTEKKIPDLKVRNEVSKIHSSVSDLSVKMREVIWSLSAEKDDVESLLDYIQQQARVLFENSPIKLSIFKPDQDIPHIEIGGEKRRHIYLATKEALHNCLKHSQANTCNLSMTINSNAMTIQVRDDGKGMNGMSKPGNGLRNIRKRIAHIAGKLSIETNNGTCVEFNIPLTNNI